MEILNFKYNYFDPAITGGLLDYNILGFDIYTFFALIIIITSNLFLISKVYSEDVYLLKRYLVFFFYHNCIFVFMLMSLLFNANDLDTYYQFGLLFEYEGFLQPRFQDYGIHAMSQIYRIFYYFFKLDFVSISFLFSCFGFWLIILLDKIINNNTQLHKKKFNWQYFFIFFPSLSLWNSYLGKEILTIGILILFAYFYLNRAKHIFIFFIFFSCLFFFIRPHLSFIFVLSFLIIKLLEMRGLFLKFIFLSISFSLALYLGKYFITADGNLFDILSAFFESGKYQRTWFSASPGWVDTENMNIILLYLNFLFKPLLNFYSVRNALLSFENLLILSIVVYYIFYQKNEVEKSNLFFLVFFMIGTFTMSIYSAETGIYWRQKWLFLPYLFIFLSTLKKRRNSYS